MSSSPIPQRALGGSASHIKVGQIGFGLMGMTWCPSDSMTPDAQAFEAMKAAVDAGANLWNTGAFYGPPVDPYANLKLIARFFDAHKDYIPKVVLCVKGGARIKTYSEKSQLIFDANEDNLREDLQEIRKYLKSDQGGHDVDLYEMARKDVKVSTEEMIARLQKLSKEGLFTHISLSEVGEETIRAACKIAPIAAVEIEYSPWELSVETNGVLKTCEEFNVPIFAYSPVGKGMLTGEIKSRSDIPQGDMRLTHDRWSEENFDANLKLAHAFVEAAKAHSPPCTAAQLTLAWLVKQNRDGLIIPIPGSSRPSRVHENTTAGSIKIDDKVDQQIRSILNSIEIKGGRYNEAMRQHLPLFA